MMVKKLLSSAVRGRKNRNQKILQAFFDAIGGGWKMTDRKVVTPTESRQATPQRLNYRVLTRSLLIALVAAVIVYAYFYMQSPA